jgi:RimJ/RimL family protein N-acetyltransferase
MQPSISPQLPRPTDGSPSVPVKPAGPAVTLRPWARADAATFLRLAADREIWLNLRERFPHPLTLPAAELWIADHAEARAPLHAFAVIAAGELAGGLTLRRREEPHAICADLTFWVGRPFWGRGIATAAVGAATAYAFDTLGLERVQAFVYDWNAASSRVLEHAGFAFEGRLRRYVLKDGRSADALLYAKLRG